MLYDAAIVGGGVAGGATASAMLTKGATVVLFERRDLSRDPNRGDALHPPSVRLLDAWGVTPELKRRGAFEVHRGVVTDGHGRILIDQDTGSHPLLMLSHGEIEAALLDTAKAGGAKVISRGVRSVRREGEAWLLDTEEGVFRARLLVGADGPTSLVRQSLAIQLDQHEYPEAAVILHGRQPDWLPPRCVCIVLHPEGSILLVPTTPEGRYRVPVLVERADVPHWMSAGDDEIRARLAARYPKLASVAVERSSGGSHVYRLTRQHARTYVGECTALVGDAAHVTHPSGGQGMNLAIQDAGALAQYTGLVLGSPAASRPHLQDAIARSLAEYEKERRPINNRAMVVADRTARLARPGWMAYASAVAGARVAAILPGVPRLFVDLFGGG